MFLLVRCPTCDSPRIKKVRRTWTDQYQGRTYSVPDLEFQECPDCGEQIYDRDAMRKIEAYSPAYAKRRGPRGARKPRRSAAGSKVKT